MASSPATEPRPATSPQPVTEPRPAHGGSRIDQLKPPELKPSTLLGRAIRWVLVLGLAGAGWYYSPVWLPVVQAYLPRKTGPGGPSRPRVVPVRTATVQQRDVELTLSGLGTVTSLNTVTVRSRVEGELIKVAFTEGQLVKAGQLLAEIDPRPFERARDQARGAVSRDEAALSLARLNLTRQEDLLKSNATTRQVYDQQVATVTQAEATVEASRAALENAELQLAYCRITAPIDGRVGLRLVDEGNMVRANDPNGLLVITKVDPIGVVFTIPQDEIPRLQRRLQEDASPRVELYDRDLRNQIAEGKLIAIDNQVDPSTGTLRLKAEFDNSRGTLFPNQFVNTRMGVESLAGAIVVPSAAVQRGIDGPYVYLVRNDDTVELRLVAAGPTQGTDTVVLTGLSVNDIVVTDGIDKLTNGTPISYRDESTADKGKGAAPNAGGQPTRTTESTPRKDAA